MNINILIYLLSLLSAGLILFIINAFLVRQFKNKLNSDEPPLTFQLIKFSLFIAGAVLVHEMIVPLQTLAKVLPLTKAGGSLLSNSFLYFSLFLAIIVLSLFLLIWLAYLFCSLFSKGRNIYFETANGNMSIVLTYCAIVIALAIISVNTIAPMLDSLIPYPTIPVYR